MSVDEANAWLMGSSAQSCSFLNIGDKHEGQITAVEMGVQRDLQTGKPKVWDDGTPIKQMIVTLQTDERDSEAEADDGIRKLYVGSKGMREALAAAVKVTGAGGIAVGGRLGMKYKGDGVPTQKGFNPPKEYVAKYEPPTVSVDAGYEDDQYSDEPF
jgi:hypothetical protein